MDETYFWNKLEAEYGTINPHIRNILKRQNLCSQSLAQLNVEAIRQIEEDMRIMAQSIRDEAAAGGHPLHDIYGQTYANQPENFRFLRGEVMCLLDLASIMQKKGIKYFLNTKKRATINIELYDETAEQHSSTLYEKIMLHFTSQGIEDTNYNELLEQLKTIDIRVFSIGNGKFRAEALCPICQINGKTSKVSFSMDERRNWHIYSFTRHSNTLHYQMPECSKRKRRRSPPSVISHLSNEANFKNTSTDDKDTSSDSQNTSSTGSQNYSLSISCDPLGSAESETSTVLNEDRPQFETMEEERIDEQDGTSNDDEHLEDKLCEELATDEIDIINTESIIRIGNPTQNEYESIEPTTSSNNNSTALLDVQINMNKRFELQGTYGVRYTEYEHDVAAYLLLTSGKSAYKFKRANMHLPSLSSTQRHIIRHTNDTREGVLMVNQLVKYMTANNFPKVVALSEDGTSLSPNPEYSPRTDSVRGLVAPFDSKGMPKIDLFKATSACKMIHDLKKYPVGEYLYVVMATPMAPGASPICLMYMCSDNKFNHLQIKQRWAYVESELKKAGIKVIAHASDGDPRLLRAMKERTQLPHPAPSLLYGPYFTANMDDEVVCIQDTVHLVNKLRHALLNPNKHMVLGKYEVSSENIRKMIEIGDKMVHKMNLSDLNPADKMKFDPSIKLMESDLIEHLIELVPYSIGTAMYLKIMQLIYTSFVEENLSPTERICTIWTSLFFIRAWRWECLERATSVQQCTTSNVYWCLELNAHELVHFLVNCRENNAENQFIVQHLNSQPCETSFRELRSMTTMNHTAVNFTMKDVEQRMQRVQMKLLIAHRRKDALIFPNLRQRASRAYSLPCDLPNDNQIALSIEKAEQNARELLVSVGFDDEKLKFTNSLILRNPTVTHEVEFVNVDESQGVTIDCTDADQCKLNDEASRQKVIIECAKDVFPKTGGENTLKRCNTKRNRNVFKIRRITGKVVNVSKSKMLWILSSGRFRRTSDRLRRFHRIRGAQRKIKTN